MKVVILLFFFLFLSIPHNAYAHLRGVPITTMNGKNTIVYPAQTVQSFVFDLPSDSDLAPENYLVGEGIEVVIDTTMLPVPQEIFRKTNLIWDFGDGTPKQIIKNGNKNSHVYNKQGTYIMTVHTDYEPAGFADVGLQQLQASVLHVLPNIQYQLPKVNIVVNGKSSSPTKEFAIDLNNAVTFSAEITKSSGKISSYKWNFDDGSESDTKTATHRYKLPQYYATPVLRVTDENGFFTDEYVSIKNSGKNEPNDPEKEERGVMVLVIGASTLITLLVVIVGIYLFKRGKKK